jgi:hypothetical protein
MEQQAVSLRSQINAIWDRLHISDIEREAFSAKTCGVTQQTLHCVS